MATLPITWINALFERFESFYGQEFARKWSIGNVQAMKLEWAEALGKFDGETLRLAVEHCRENVQRPPSLPEFATICKNMKPAPEHHALLPVKFEPTQYGMQMMFEIKKMLAKKKIA